MRKIEPIGKANKDFDLLVEYQQKGTLSALIIESSDLAIKAKTLAGIITSWNRGAEKIYGYKAKEIIGKNVSLLIPPNHDKELAKLNKQINAGKVISNYETKRVKKDGEVINVSLSLSPIKGKDGKLIGVVTLDRDITALVVVNKELLFQNKEKGKRADELLIANKELLFQNKEKGKRADELAIANIELAFQNKEKEKRASELIIANKELIFQTKEKGKRADELLIADKELAFQNKEKEKRASELIIANKELIFQTKEKGKRADELLIADKELVFQNKEKEKRANELGIANKELIFQTKEKVKRADELVIAAKELLFETAEKGKRAAELIIANKELVFQTKEKGKRETDHVKLKALSEITKQASQYARSLIEASTDPLVTISPEGKIMDVNEASVKITGVSRDKLIGTDFSDYFTEPDKARKGYQTVFEKLVVSDYPLTIRHIKGKLTDVLYNASVYKDDKGNVLGVFAAARDITAIKQASNYARSIIEASRDPLFAISSDGKIIDVNEATIQATDISRNKIIGTDFVNYFTDKAKAQKGFELIFKNGFINDYSLTIVDGKLTDVFCNGAVNKDDKGQILGAVIVARDVTVQNKIASELLESKVFAEKATLIAEDAKSKAESATRIAEDAVRAKQQFLSNMSHEIRTPMNAIIGFTKVILKTHLTAKQLEYLNAIKLSGDALIVLINDILDLAKVDAGKMIFEKVPFKMSASISAILHLFDSKIQEKNLKLIRDYDDTIPQVLVGDPVRLHQIILNLVSNAIKFTSLGSVTTRVKMVAQDKESVTIKFEVTDTGIGIPENELDRIFENFQQASSGTSRLFGGTGLGLAIVKQLVEPQGGTIKVTSELGKGSTFAFTLSFMKTNAEVEREEVTALPNDENRNIKVLVVEDIALNQLLMKTLLDDFGFERDIASNGLIAIEKLKLKSYDIILMDLQMPEMNGLEATEYIRNTLHSKIPIIALTADVTTADLAKCKAVGMNDYIAKPVDERILYNKIVGLVKKPILNVEQKQIPTTFDKKQRYINLEYLKQITKSNPVLLAEMISVYLEQTPPLIFALKNSLLKQDWEQLKAAAHKLIPSFTIMGINIDYEKMARQIQNSADKQMQGDIISDLVTKLEDVLTNSCRELEHELNLIKTITK